MTLRRSVQFALALVVASVALAFGSAAGAVDNPDYTAPPPTSVVSNSTPPAVRESVAATPAARERLAITGSDATQMAVVGGLLVAGGAATLGLRRRHAFA
ncbi:MAG TPA: LPXTG cell wall anchor domain-containing protein [Aquihabitans sp.]|jgi:LPXTG-motif cell wall-anchored protein|nr:LPXTG cell wall anchor domain-containing protein [Aquihabitans sp.]